MSAIEVRLRQKNIAVTGQILREDESTEPITVTSLSMRGAQRAVTADLQAQGYAPHGRWVAETDEARGLETWRRFAKA